MKSSFDLSQASVWPLQTLASLITEMRGGAPLKPSDFTKSGVKVVPKGGIGRKGWLEVADHDLQYCSEEFANAHRANQVNDEFTLVVLRDLVPAGPSIGLIVRMRDADSWVLAQGVYGFKLNENADPSYLSQVSNTQWYRRIMNQIMVGSTQVHITNTAFKLVAIPMPEIEEQRAISAALSDVDALIAGLEKLIAKKRDLKQAAMQQLLTGQTRLPGFSGEWQAVTLNEVCWFQEGPGVRNTQFANSGVKLLNGTNIFRGSLNLDSTIRFISELEAYGPYAHFMAEEGDIVLASSGITIDRLNEKVSFVRAKDLPFCMNTSTIRFKPNPVCMAPMFLYQFLVSDDFKTQIGEVATGSAQLNFGPSHVEKVNIQIPCLDEQVEIGAVLSGMDNELAAMELRLAKTRDLKQGMMRELLTGRTRLV